MKIQTNFFCHTNQYQEVYRISYNSWGDPAASKVLLCLHGLSRNSRDFDFLAESLVAQDYYIIAPDLPGRGNSDYLKDYRGYSLESNLADLEGLIRQLQLTNIDIVGVSLGGILGMLLTSMGNVSVRRLVLNDIGAEVNISGIMRIAKDINVQSEFVSYAQAYSYLKEISHNDGIYDDTVWQHMCINSFQKNALKHWELKRDAKLALSLAEKVEAEGIIQFWADWAKIVVPTLIIHGVQSDLLSLETIHKMQQINLQAELLSVADAGHVPYLYRPEHLKRIGSFLQAI